MNPPYIVISEDNAAQKNKTVQWAEECQKAFQVFKDLCTSTPILTFADVSTPFKLNTDASKNGSGAVLYQEQGGLEIVIGYTSQTLNKIKTNYAVHK